MTRIPNGYWSKLLSELDSGVEVVSPDTLAEEAAWVAVEEIGLSITTARELAGAAVNTHMREE